MTGVRIAELQRLVVEQYQADDLPWFLGFSGGKDSSALLAAVYSSLLSLENAAKPVTVVYCDTGVEIPTMADYVMRTLGRLREQVARDGLPIAVQVLTPRLEDSFFVKVIGSGYPSPTNKFRWCTDRLRVGPVRRAMSALSIGASYMLLGTRWGESEERSRTLARFHQGQRYFKQAGNGRTTIFAPISDLSSQDVWRFITSSDAPECLNGAELAALYRSANGSACSGQCVSCERCVGGRFGCWVCTVVRKDRAVSNMVKDGHPELRPLLEFRNWLAIARDRPEYRWQRRRNGQPGPGPFTLEARREILARLHAAQGAVPWSLLLPEEEAAILRIWAREADLTGT